MPVTCVENCNKRMQKSRQMVHNMFIRYTAVFSPHVQKFVSVHMQQALNARSQWGGSSLWNWLHITLLVHQIWSGSL